MSTLEWRLTKAITIDKHPDGRDYIYDLYYADHLLLSTYDRRFAYKYLNILQKLLFNTSVPDNTIDEYFVSLQYVLSFNENVI